MRLYNYIAKEHQMKIIKYVLIGFGVIFTIIVAFLFIPRPKIIQAACSRADTTSAAFSPCKSGKQLIWENTPLVTEIQLKILEYRTLKFGRSPFGNDLIVNQCQLETVYETTAVTPSFCQCPSGYTRKIIDIFMGPCPTNIQATDCPANRFKCVSTQ